MGSIKSLMIRAQLLVMQFIVIPSVSFFALKGSPKKFKQREFVEIRVRPKLGYLTLLSELAMSVDSQPYSSKTTAKVSANSH